MTQPTQSPITQAQADENHKKNLKNLSTGEAISYGIGAVSLLAFIPLIIGCVVLAFQADIALGCVILALATLSISIGVAQKIRDELREIPLRRGDTIKVGLMPSIIIYAYLVHGVNLYKVVVDLIGWASQLP